MFPFGIRVGYDRRDINPAGDDFISDAEARVGFGNIVFINGVFCGGLRRNGGGQPGSMIFVLSPGADRDLIY